MQFLGRIMRFLLRNEPERTFETYRVQAEEEKRKEEKQLGEKVNSLVMNTLGPNDDEDQDIVESYRQLFKLFDKNDDGSISVDELGHVFRIHLGKSLSENDLNRIIEQVDENQSKTIEFSEFLTLMASETWNEIEKGEIVKAFAVFDRNKDGYVDAQELRFALCTYGEAMTQQEADELLAIADLDKNGLIDYNEFQAMMTADEESGDCRQQ
ncbi:neo-calmodulin-like isoform X4 [Bolinopsis microptera]|uniref:neo-calmodulin-like isoform X4 n=1 Tax=Bolinopsis microptera TaxID=2820187 RepID=UPI0030797146